VTKFVGKFRKNKNYNDDYNYDYKRHRNEHAEIKKMLDQKNLDEYYENFDKYEFSPGDKN
jgi:hypothetical protein